MVERLVASLVDFSRRFAFLTVLLFLLLTGGGAYYAATHFSITTDVTKLLDEKAAWRQREIAFARAFPQRGDLLVMVIDGANSVDTDLAAAALYNALKAKPDLFKTVKRPDADAYLQANGLMLLSPDDLSATTEGLIKAQPLLATLSADPSLRGLFNMLGLMLDGATVGQVDIKDLMPLFSRVERAMASTLHWHEDESWRYLLASENPSKFELRRFVLTQPVLDYSALAPGEKASSFIRDTISELNLTQKYNVTIRLTGDVALSDDEFSSVSEGMGEALIGSTLIILFILYFTLRSWRIILPIFITLLCGLTLTTATALIMVGSLNLISVAFAVMFTGIAVDFGIQFGVRFRDARAHIPDFAEALKRAATLIAVPLLLAAMCTALGFFSFIPTSYRGVAELGLIAGAGMVIAYIANITLLPALISIFKPSPAQEAIGLTALKPVDDFLLNNRKTVLLFFAVAFVVAAVTSLFLPYDFDPLNLKDKKAESVSTMFDLMKDPDTSPYTIDVLAKNMDEADALKIKLEALPEVAEVRTLKSFIPQDQEEKAAILNDAANLLALALNPPTQKPAPTVEEIQQAANSLSEKFAAIKDMPPEGEALRKAIARLSEATPETIQKISLSMQAVVSGTIEMLKARLTPKSVTMDDFTPELRRDWMTEDGTTRLEVYAKGDAHDRPTRIKFVNAVQKVAPDATGASVSIQESAAVIKGAFIEAAIYSTVMIFLLLLILLKNLRHTLFVLVPLILAFALTLGTTTLLNLPINFANIIALPLLLGLGVSYSIYFVVYWIQGFDQPLQSSMARAVLASACTTFVAFGSLSLSNHTGTASMGLLLSLSLIYVLFTTFFFLPALLGKCVKSETK